MEGDKEEWRRRLRRCGEGEKVMGGGKERRGKEYLRLG